MNLYSNKNFDTKANNSLPLLLSLYSDNSFERFLNRFKKKKLAFTLAEVLMCLWIIGVVAAMTIPTLMTNLDEQINVVKLKKVYSQLSQSFLMATLEYGTPDEWGLTNSKVAKKDAEGNIEVPMKNDSAQDFLKKLLTGLKAEDISGTMRIKTNYLARSKSEAWNVSPYYRLPDGTIFIGSWVAQAVNGESGSECSRSDLVEGAPICGDINVDLNGYKGPNVIGIDQFEFWVSKTGIIPMGGKKEIQRTLKTYCNTISLSYNGYGCTAYAIEKGKMPWLKGKKPSWDD